MNFTVTTIARSLAAHLAPVLPGVQMLEDPAQQARGDLDVGVGAPGDVRQDAVGEIGVGAREIEDELDSLSHGILPHQLSDQGRKSSSCVQAERCCLCSQT